MYYASHQFIYRYLSKCQGTKYAVTAVHTPQEKALFANMMDNSKYSYIKSGDRAVNFYITSAAWSSLCSSSNYIYYMTPEHLYHYSNILEDRRKYRDTVAHNFEVSKSIRSAAQSKRRYNVSVPAKKCRRLGEHGSKLATLALIISPPVVEEKKPTLINIAPKALVFMACDNESTTSNNVDNNNTSAEMLINTSCIDSNVTATSTASSTSTVVKNKRAPRECQLCQQCSPICKGSSQAKYCQFKYYVCKKNECPARYGGKEQCILNSNLL